MAFRKSANPVRSTVQLDKELVDIEAYIAPATNASAVKLFKNDFTPTSASVLADFTEAAFTGYAAVVLTAAMLTPIITGPGIKSLHGNIDFIASGSPTPETIFGYYVTSPGAAPTTMSLAERFTNPVPIAVAGDAVILELNVPVQALQATGVAQE
jgi:hypothetical protein